MVVGEFTNTNASDFEEFQTTYVIMAMVLVWIILKEAIAKFTPKSGRVIGIIHALCTVLLGIPVLLILAIKSFDYADMYESITVNSSSILLTCNLISCISIGYFIADSYFIADKAYLKHHLGAITAWVFATYHHHTSLVHGTIVISLFETGAILVQCSRMFPDVLWFRFLVCAGYTLSRISLTWYYGFILYTASKLAATNSMLFMSTYIPIFSALAFLLVLNAQWTILQWKSFARACQTKEEKPFFAQHQDIIGSTSVAA